MSLGPSKIPFVRPPVVTAPPTPPPPVPAHRRIPVTEPAREALAQTINEFEREMGGRSAALKALALANLDAKLRPEQIADVVGLLADPANADKSLLEIAQIGEVTIDDLLRVYRHALVMRAHLQCIRIVSERIPAVVTDVMKKAAPYQDACSSCQGVGKVTPEPTRERPNPEPVDCRTCAGVGQLMYQPTHETQKLALQIAGLLKSGGLTIIAHQNQVNNPIGPVLAADDVFLKVQQTADEVLYGQRPPAAPPALPELTIEEIDATPPATEGAPDATLE